MSHFARIYKIVASFILLPGVALSAQTMGNAPLPNSQSISTLGSELFQQSGSTGMVLVVVRGNQVFFNGYGETAPNSHQVPTRDSVVRICSLTKTFTTDLLAKLVVDKTVRLNDPLQNFAPSHVIVPSKAQAITLLDLATHTAGLPRELGNGPSGSAHFTFPDYTTRWRWLPNQRLRSTPGTEALYSNIGFDLLGDALQSATHKQFAALLSERTLVPLHLWHTTFFPNADQCSRLLRSADDQGPCTVTEASAGSGGLYSTASDMEIWLSYLLRNGNIPTQGEEAQGIYIQPSKLLSQKGLDHAGEPTGIGLGWIHILPIDSPSHIIQKTGGGAGFSTYIAINHARNTAIFLAATDGPVNTHLNLFNAANKLLLAVAGLPPLPAPTTSNVATSAPKHRRRVRQR